MFRFSGGKEHVELPNGKSEHLSEMLDDVPISSHGTTELVFWWYLSFHKVAPTPLDHHSPGASTSFEMYI